MTPTDFRARFALERLEEGALLVDLEGGGYFRLNETAAIICTALSDAKDTPSAIALLSHQFNELPESTTTLVKTFLQDLSQSERRERPTGPFRYSLHGTRYCLEEDGSPRVFVDPTAKTLSLAVRVADLKYPVLDYVRAVTPKLLGFLGIRVLHAASCTVAGESIAFAGRSGAGKTTTAKALAAAGARLSSEDLLLLSDGETLGTSFFTFGERLAHTWADLAAAQISSGRDVPFGDLAAAATGPQERLHAIWFLDVTRRRGNHLQQYELDRVSGLGELLRHLFLARAGASNWRSQVQAARRLAANLQLSEAVVPDGIALLTQAAADYVTLVREATR
ncbi:MAG TPA: PqqD family protein [Polyangia bacterium]|nr:PqqD family protein [Polyangia bacterium]